MANYLTKILGRPNNKQDISELANQMAQNEAAQIQQIPLQETMETAPQPLQGQVQPSDKDMLKNAALSLIMKQMQPQEEVAQPMTAGDIVGRFKEGGIGSGLKGLVEFAGTPEGMDLIGSIAGATGKTGQFMGAELEQQAQQERKQQQLAEQEAELARQKQEETALDVYKDITGTELEEEKLEFEREKYGISEKVAEAESIAKEAKNNFEAEEKLRKEFTKNSGDFIKIRDAFNRVEASAKKPSAAGDLALIFNYMKILDPGSVVREGEFANAQNSAGVPERIRAQYNKIKRGERLTEVTRADFVDKAQELYGAQAEMQEALINEYKRLADEYRLKPTNIIGTAPLKDVTKAKPKSFTTIEDAEAASLPAGTKIIINGRRAVVE